MLGFHLVSVTLHGRFTMGIEQDKQNWWHFCVNGLYIESGESSTSVRTQQSYTHNSHIQSNRATVQPLITILCEADSSSSKCNLLDNLLDAKVMIQNAQVLMKLGIFTTKKQHIWYTRSLNPPSQL